MANDTFTQNLFDYGTLELFANTESDTAILQISNGAYGLPLRVSVDKQNAFSIYNNACVNTHEEMKKIMMDNRVYTP